MKQFALSFIFCVIMTPGVLFGQEDASRTSGLPSRIGGNRCNGILPGSNATVTGSLNVQGTISSEKPPVFTVALYSSGILITKQRLKNGGAYNFACVPMMGVVLVAEIDSTEIASFPMGNLDGPPATNRQDMFVNWSDAAAAIKRRNEIVSVKDAYKRTDKNQNLFGKAMDALDKKKAESAAKSLRQLLENDPDDFVAWVELANIHFNGGRFAEAASAYEKAFALNNGFVPAAVGAGRANIAIKKLDAAIELLSRADNAKPNSADINHYLGEAYLQNRKGSLAIVHMRKAIEISPPEKADLYLRIAALYHAAGGKALAAQEYKKLLQLKPQHPDRDKLLRYISENSN
jgi:Tfp pilus assembly protein PilF